MKEDGDQCGHRGRKVTHGNVGMKNQMQTRPWGWRRWGSAMGVEGCRPGWGMEGRTRTQAHGHRATRGSPEQGQGWWLRLGADSAPPQLLEMKSTDRKQTLLHYLVRVIMEKYPELTGFHTELHFLDKAGTGSAQGPRAGGRGSPWHSEPALTPPCSLPQCPWTGSCRTCGACSRAWS